MYCIRPHDQKIEKSISSKKPLLARLLSQRKIEDVDHFLNPPNDAYLCLKNIKLVKNIKDVSDLIIDMGKNGKTAAVSGDYDGDGIVSSYMIKRLCEIMNIECNVFLPSRFEHGYGLNEKTLGAFLGFTIINKVPDVLFILDCGSSSEKEIQELRSHHNINKIVVIDHHSIKEDSFSKSANFIINWRLSNAQEMCTCGLVYLIALDLFNNHMVLTQANLKELLSLAAIGTIADVSPIIDDNRIIVKNGLSFFKNLSSEGLATLVKFCKLRNITITQQQVGFRLVPRLNAVGRLGSPQEAFDLLVSKDKDEIEDIMQSIEITNQQRQKIQGDILEEAMEMVDEKEMSYGILLVSPKWNIGVVGIVASKIVDKLHKPTVVIGRDKGVWKGSGRSIEGLSLIKILDQCKDMFVKYGGHEAAAGVSIKKNYLDKSVKMFNNACQKVLTEEKKNCDKKIFYDVVLKMSSVNNETYELVKKLYPYCNINNPEPVFKLSDVKMSLVDKKENANWTLSIFKVDGINYKFKTFDKEIINCDSRKVNVYFKFPQSYEEKWGMSLDVVGVEVLDK